MLQHLRETVRQRRDRKNIYSTEAYWDSKAVAYADTAVSMWPNQALTQVYDREQKELIGSLLGDVRGLSLLDLGCGVGRFSRWFTAQGASVAGVDFSSGALEIAKRQSPNGNPAYRCASVFELEDENAYNVVFVWGVLTLACVDKSQLLAALKRVRRALRQDGRLFLTEPIHRGFLHRVLDLDLREFLSVVREAGFEVRSITPLHFWPMRLLLCYVSWPSWFTTPLYHLGQAVMKLPGFSRLGDYRAILAHPTEVPPDPGNH
jgi:2-polyprenyl-3-methyl-5-hydroxy-6-metoxy-1,4-benzoquinol methylase